MREIFFRGKDPEKGFWFEGQYICLHKTTRCFNETKESEAENEIHQIVFEQMTDWNLPNRHLRADVLPETVGQYTGLTDKNGKRIFEGDIVKGAWGTVFVVYYDECYLQFRAKKADSYAREIDYYGDSNEIEILGNIHDNPDLLESEDTE